jgi:hypothetical protein
MDRRHDLSLDGVGSGDNADHARGSEPVSEKVTAENHAVFNFKGLAPQLDRVMMLSQGSLPWKPIEFPWRQR